MALASDYRTSASDPANATSYSFASQDIGTASSDRYVLVAIAGRGSAALQQITALTIGGVSASQVAKLENGLITVAFWAAAVPTGTTATVAVTLDGTWARCFLAGVWALTGLSSTTPVNTYTDTTFTAGALSVSADCPAGGGLFGIVHQVAADTWTWAGITERSDIAVESTEASAASLDFAAAQTALTVSATRSGSGSGNQALLVIALAGVTVTNKTINLTATASVSVAKVANKTLGLAASASVTAGKTVSKTIAVPVAAAAAVALVVALSLAVTVSAGVSLGKIIGKTIAVGVTGLLSLLKSLVTGGGWTATSYPAAANPIVIPAETRAAVIKAEVRGIAIPAEERGIAIPAEPRRNIKL